MTHVHNGCFQKRSSPTIIPYQVVVVMSHNKASNMFLSIPAEPDDRSPLHRLDGNHHLHKGVSCGVISSQTITSAAATLQESHPALRREQHRHKLASLYHAACCTHSGPTACPKHTHCLAHKRIFTHMKACREGARCAIPGCAKARLIWTHFATCAAPDCDICSVIPQRRMVPLPGQAPLPRRAKDSGRPPLSPKSRYSYDLPPRSPPRSPKSY